MSEARCNCSCWPASFALAGYAGVRLLADDWLAVAVWFVGAALLHDLVLLPLYSAADRAVVRGPVPSGGSRWAMYVRVPAALVRAAPAGVVPADHAAIGGRRYRPATGLSPDGLPGPLAADHGRAVRRLGAAAGAAAAQGDEAAAARRPLSDGPPARPAVRAAAAPGAEPRPGERRPPIRAVGDVDDLHLDPLVDVIGAVSAINRPPGAEQCGHPVAAGRADRRRCRCCRP